MKFVFALVLSAISALAHAEVIGDVDTAFQWIGPNHKIQVEVFDDPRVPGVSCFLSRAKTGGMKGWAGLAEDKAEASVACRQIGDFRFTGPLPLKEEVFSEKTSLVFKHQRVVRMVDPKRNVLVYMAYSDRLVDGSPKNSVSAVPVPAAMKIPLK
jgi:CreA protein